jgi:hypothetical protein
MTVNCAHRSSSLYLLILVVVAAACSSNGSNGSNGNGKNTPPTPAPIPPELQKFADGLAAMANGADADLDGDGLPDVRTVVAGDGTRTVSFISVLGYYGGPALLTITYAPNGGDVTVTGDLDEDNTIDFVGSSVIAGDTLTEQFSWDFDDDGSIDRRVTSVYPPITDRNTATITVTTEEATGDPPQFAATSIYTGSIRTEAGDPCEGLITYPSGDGASVSSLGRPNMRVMTNGEPGACSQQDADRIVKAINKVAGDFLKCLKSQNKPMYSDIVSAMSTRNLQISCGNNCNLPNGTYSMANTEMPGHWHQIFDDPRMSLNMSKLGSDDCLASIMLHEMAHWSGTAHEGDATGKGGTDAVYACGRYCGGCITANCGLGAGDSAYDCSKCSRTSSLKYGCGWRELWQQVEHGNDTKFCHNQDNWAQYDDCPEPVLPFDVSCDGEKLFHYGSTPCCVSCPAGEAANSFSCAQWYGPNVFDGAPYPSDSPVDNCNNPPNCE